MIKVSFLIVLLYALGRLIFNTDGDIHGSFNTNTTLYLNSFVSMSILVFIFMLKKNFFKFQWHGLYKIVFFYYTFALMSSIYSGIAVLSLYNSFIGFFYVIASIVLGEKIVINNHDIEKQFYAFMKILSYFAFFGILTSAYFEYTYTGVVDFISKGVPADFNVTLILFIAFVLITKYSNFKSLTIAILLIILSLRLNSFSAILSFFGMILFYLLYKKKYILFSTIFLFLFLGGSLFIDMISSGVGSMVINNKPAEAYMTGSGRFDLYMAAFDAYSSKYNLFERFFGTGFMAERNILKNYDLPWVTDPHNAFILNLLGLGVFGAFFYFLFLFYPFYFYNKVKDFPILQKYTLIWLCFHIISILFSISSSYYLGRPSFLLLFSLSFYYILYQNYKLQKRIFMKSILKQTKALF